MYNSTFRFQTFLRLAYGQFSAQKRVSGQALFQYLLLREFTRTLQRPRRKNISGNVEVYHAAKVLDTYTNLSYI